MTKNNQPAVPVLRFKEFAGEWEHRKLKNFLEFKNGINANKEQYGSGIKFINVSDIIENDFITYSNIIGKVNVDEKTFQKNEVKYGDILFQRSSETRKEVGQSNVYLDDNRSALFGGFVIRGQMIRKYQPEFMNLLLKTSLIRHEITSKSGGSTRYNVGQETLKSVNIRIPTLPEQQKIATFLTAVARNIQQLREKQNLLQQYKKGVMQRIFSQEIRFKRADGTDFGAWEEKKLGDITTLFSNRNKKLINAPVYSVTNYDGFVLQTEHFDKEVAGSDLSNYKIVKNGDFAYNPARINVGSIAHFENEVGIISSLYVCFRTKKELLDDFLLNFLEIDYTKHQIEVYGEGGVRVYLWYPLFASIKINLPTVAEQQKIANFLTQLDKKINGVAAQLAAVKAFKKGLLQQLFV